MGSHLVSVLIFCGLSFSLLVALVIAMDQGEGISEDEE